ncbi:MAG: MoxR family ATPase [Cyclobacteriaceae bacterium]|nr:MoxR family ATPase [Cyclobacteriaceae bacterium]
MGITITTEEEINDLLEKLPKLKSEIGKIIIGQDDAIEQILIALLAGGHALLEGVPGLAKTLMVRILAKTIDVQFKRIQFTPDLMPSDILGTELLEEDHNTGKKFFKFNKGPIFSNILLADEINRTPPKTQAALLEAMQEYEVTYAGNTYPLAKPFFILATQNPIEQAGTFPLPEAQLDRFLLYIKIGYPNEEEEEKVLTATTGGDNVEVNQILCADEVIKLQSLVREITISEDLIRYVNKLVRSTRPDTTDLEYVKKWVRWGAGPRAGQSMIMTAKARALLQNRFAVTEEDIQKVVFPVLRHRMLLNFRAEAERITTDKVTSTIAENIKVAVDLKR